MQQSHTAPKTETSLGKDASHLLRQFMIHCEQNNIPLGWSKHITFLKWLTLMQHSAVTETTLRLELLAATALSWAQDHYDAWECSRIIIFDKVTNIAVGTIRPAQFSDSVRIVRLRLENLISFQPYFKSRMRRQASRSDHWSDAKTVQTARRATAQQSRQSYTNEIGLELKTDKEFIYGVGESWSITNWSPL